MEQTNKEPITHNEQTETEHGTAKDKEFLTNSSNPNATKKQINDQTRPKQTTQQNA
ncbi:hypothetical protein IJM86_05335 [bacterium]|nr:hypothetical protein [bacterium]